MLAHGEDGRHILIHDPWVEEELGETIADAAMSPLSTFSTASHGSAVMGSGAAVILEKGRIDDDLRHSGRAPRILHNGATPHKVMTTRDYLAHPALFNGQLRPRIINLSRSTPIKSRMSYASLLAEARGHRIIPSVETMIDSSERRLYENAIPELEDMLNKALGKHPERAPETIHVHFGLADNPEFERFGRLLFDWFRAPSLEVTAAG